MIIRGDLVSEKKKRKRFPQRSMVAQPAEHNLIGKYILTIDPVSIGEAFGIS
jgi:hypothetical protein